MLTTNNQRRGYVRPQCETVPIVLPQAMLEGSQPQPTVKINDWLYEEEDNMFK